MKFSSLMLQKGIKYQIVSSIKKIFPTEPTAPNKSSSGVWYLIEMQLCQIIVLKSYSYSLDFGTAKQTIAFIL